MNDKITLVTGFFDIGRKDYKEIPRTNEQYITYFKRWARLKNNLVCFVESEELANIVLKIRAEFGLKEKTRVHIVENIFNVESDLLAKMEKVENNADYLNFRVRKDAPENKAKYDYVMLMKLYCMKMAANEFSNDKFVSWLDFGWEHGGRAYENESDYEFEWKYPFEEDKVTLFYIPPMQNVPIFEMVRTLGPDCVMGAPVVCDKNKVEEFYDKAIETMFDLCEMGFIDDDQLVFTLMARRWGKLFSLKESYWFRPLKDYGGEHMKLKPAPKVTFIQKIKNLIKKVLHIRRKV